LEEKTDVFEIGGSSGSTGVLQGPTAVPGPMLTGGRIFCFRTRKAPHRSLSSYGTAVNGQSSLAAP
jgi:hypothetical protein